MRAALADPQAEARGDVVDYEHPALGRRPRPGVPVPALDGSDARRRRAGRLLGEHTHDVLRELCGYDEERLAQLARPACSATPSEKEESMSDQWRGRFLEDFAVGDVYRSRLGRTVSEADNTWFTCLTMNTNQMHFNRAYAARTEFGEPLVVSTLTLAIVLGLSVADTSRERRRKSRLERHQAAEARLRRRHALGRERGPRPCASRSSRPSCGIVGIRTRGINQRGEVVIEFTRSFMVFKRDAPEVADVFPATTSPGRCDAA